MINNIKDFNGKTISASELIQAEYGRTYDAYLCLVFTDGTKAMLGCVSHPINLYGPKPLIEEMKKAPSFFSPEDIAERVVIDERDRRQIITNQQQRDKNEYKRLKKKLNK